MAAGGHTGTDGEGLRGRQPGAAFLTTSSLPVQKFVEYALCHAVLYVILSLNLYILYIIIYYCGLVKY
jgi:hypothetical protein